MKETINNPSNENMMRVEKVWGEEHWIVNKEYCGKNLLLRRGFRCSMHSHKIKDETFYIVSGSVIMELADETGSIKKRWLMKKGDIQYIPQNLYHRFTGLEDSEIIEFSSMHRDSDSYRIENSGKVPEEDFRILQDEFNN